MTKRSKLAVILHADVVGSTALVHKDERVAHERIQEAFRRFSETISAYTGTTLELRGDALVAEFERASDAVSAALAFQTENQRFNNNLADDIRPEVRVGMALGEVVIADQTVTGAGVVLAQRLEQLAKPGGLCISAAIREALPARLPFEYGWRMHCRTNLLSRYCHSKICPQKGSRPFSLTVLPRTLSLIYRKSQVCS